MAKAPQINVSQNPKEPIPVDVVATEIRQISRGIAALRVGPLKMAAVEVLLAHSTKVPITTIRTVLAGIENLQREYCR